VAVGNRNQAKALAPFFVVGLGSWHCPQTSHNITHSV
jgi:hypothetical protein